MKQLFLISTIMLFAIVGKSQDLLCSWHFDTLKAAPNTAVIIPADSGLQDGTAKIYLDGTNGSSTWITATTGNELTAFGGSTINDGRISSANTMSLTPVNNTANNKGFVIKFSTSGYENPIITYATRNSTTGFQSHYFEYSIDGVTFTRFDTITGINNVFALKTVDLSSFNSLDNSPSVYIRIIVVGATASNGNTRFDNVTINATSLSPVDNTPPYVVNAEATSLTNVLVVFSEPVNATAETTGNYTNVGPIVSATRTAGFDSVNVVLGTPLTYGVFDTICISNVKDIAGNTMTGTQCFQISYGTLDVTPPTVINAWAKNLSTVKVHFNEAVDVVTAQNISNYTGLAGIGSATLNASKDTVTLALSTNLVNGVADTLYIQNVKDTAGNAMAAPQMFVLFLDTLPGPKALVITEIMYNPPESGVDSLEFIEIYNNDVVNVNLEGYTLKYGTSSFTFPAGLFINSGNFILVAPKANAASNFYGLHFIQGATNGISNSGTTVKLLSPTHVLIDSVDYKNTAPWPTDANGNGYSLSLCNPNLDNSLAVNWDLGHVAFGVINNKTVYADPGQFCTSLTDTTPPIATHAWLTNLSTVKVRFNESVSASTAENSANYTGLGTISNAILNSHKDTVTLTLSVPMISGVADSLFVTNISDSAGNIMTQVYAFRLVLDTSTTTKKLVITEIMYNPPESGVDSLEFIEIYNNDVVPVDLINYKLSYGSVNKVFDASHVINPGEYAVIAPNKAAADAFYGINSIQGPTTGITNSGTFVKIHSPSGLLVDSLTYSTSAPWPTQAAGLGSSITLCDVTADNTDGANWSASINFVGIINSINVYADPNAPCFVTSIYENSNDEIVVYPNPANDFITISGINSTARIDLFNNMGMLVLSSIADSNNAIIETSGLAEGLYYLNIISENKGVVTKPLIIIK